MNQRRILWTDLLWIFLFSFILRTVLILQNPAVYAYDAYLYLLGISSQYPVFTGFIKILIACNFSVFMIRMATAVAGSCACMAAYLFTDALFGKKTVSRTTAFLMSIYPPFLTFSLVPYTEPFFLLMFFLGLWCFEREREKGSYTSTGIFLGAACLIRYEGTLILPLILGKILLENPGTLKRPLILLKIVATFFWGVIFLSFYNRWYTPDLFAAQSNETGKILCNIVPLIHGLLTGMVDQLVPDIIDRGLVFQVLTLFSGIILAVLGCGHAMVRIRKNHLIYGVFIVLASAIQFLPLAAMFRDYSGKIIGLRRLGMVPVVFLICYFSYIVDLFIRQWIKKRAFHIIFMGIILMLPVWMSCNAIYFMISDYQKLYRKSSIQPHWVGQSDPLDAGMITSVTDRILVFHLSGKRIKKYPARQFTAIPTTERETFIKEKRIMYVFAQRDFQPIFESFLKKSEQIKFRRVAVVGQWLFVYVRER